MLRLFIILPVILAQVASAQPSTYTLQGKTFLIYPLRSDENGIPPYFAKLPDGEYIMFEEYNFRKKTFKKEYQLLDTTGVRAIFTFKNNFPEGKAVFYNSDKTISETGNFSAGLREGVWESRNHYTYGKKRESYSCKKVTYKGGIKDGEVREYSYYGKRLKSSERSKFVFVDSLHLDKTGYYKNGQPSGTWRHYYNKMRIHKEYTYTDSMSYVTNVYDQMFPNENSYDDDYASYHGKAIDNVSYPKNKTEVVHYSYGRVVYFDTLYKWYSIPEYVLVKVEKDKPDSTALFILTRYFQESPKTPDYKLKPVEITEFRGGSKIRHQEFDEKGVKEEEIFFAGYYNNLKKGDLYLRSINYYLGATRYDYSLKDYNQSFSCRVTSKGDTISKFKIYAIDTAKTTYKCIKYDRDQLTGIGWVEYKTALQILGDNQYSRGRIYEALDSTIILNKDGTRFNGNVHTFYSRKLNKDRLVLQKGTWNLYVNRKYSSSYFPFGRNKYTELRNGRENGKTISEKSYRRFKEITETYWKNGEMHGTSSTRVYNYKMDKDEREIAVKNGIKKKKVSFIKSQTEYQNGELHGKSFRADATGVITLESFFKEGLQEGAHIERHGDGKSKEKSFFVNGNLHGHYERWNFEGVLTEEADYLDGELNGYLKKNKSSGEPSFSIYAKNNILEGQAILYNQIGLMEWKLEFDARDSVPYNYRGKKDVSTLPYNERYFSWNNDNLVKNLQVRLKAYPATFTYTEYFYTGKIAAEGRFIKGRMSGLWKFYDLDGNLIHEVDFKPEEIELPHEPLVIMGKIKSYYSNGKVKSTGYLESFDRNYDCKSRKNVYDFQIHFDNYWNPEGAQTLINGNGAFTHFDEHGQKISSGEYFEHMRNGFWKSWDKDGKLSSAGHYQNNLEEGSWWWGDLEGLSFVDNACFDLDSDEVQKEINRMKKSLNIKHKIYKKGLVIDSREYRMDMNREREYGYRWRGGGSVNF